MRRRLLFLLGFLASLGSYAQTVQPGALAAAGCAGSAFSVPINASGFNAGNAFRAELSDASGSFAAPVVIGTLSATGSGTINATLPNSSGSGYRVRITSTDPATTSAANGSDIAINNAPALSVTGNSTLCTGGTIALTASGASSYAWSNAQQLPGDVAATSMAAGLRLLRTAYSGPLIRLRRSSDDAEVDFAAVSGQLDLAAISTWLNGATGYCVVLYDQSGNGRDIVQSTSYQQPRFLASSNNGRPALRFTTMDLMTGSYNFTPPYTIIATARTINGINSRVISAVNENWLLGWWGGYKDVAHFNGWVTSGSNTPNTDVSMYSAFSDGSLATVYSDGMYLSQSGAASGPNGIELNGWGNGGEMSDCEVMEVVLYPSVLAHQTRNNAEANTWAFYRFPDRTFVSLPATYSVTGTVPGCTNATQNVVVSSSAPGDPTVYGANQWNVYAFNSGNGYKNGLTFAGYAGYYVATGTDFNTLNQWNNSPSESSGFQGCPVGIDNHTWVARRKGFACGNYRLDIPNHDDVIQVYLNGSLIYEHEGCCDAHEGIWYGHLSENDSIQVIGSDGGGGSHGGLSFVSQDETSISYSNGSGCSIATSLPVNRSGLSGGAYSASPAGLSINATSGTINPSQSATGTYTVTYAVQSGAGCAPVTITANASVTINSPAGNPNNFGANEWNFYVWNSGESQNLGTSWNRNYSGYYTRSTLNFNTLNDWSNAPSDASGYMGCAVNWDNHSWSAKRQGFACGYYRIDIPNHDDEAELWVNGLRVFRDAGCCDSHTGVWFGFLGATDRVEFRVTEGGGGSEGSLNFVEVPAATISYAGTACTSGSAPLAVVRTGTGGGTYSASPAGLLIDSNTGAITAAGSSAGTYTITYTLAVTGCSLLPVTTTVTVANREEITQPSNINVCSGSVVPVTNFASSGVSGFSWTSSNPAIGLAASGSDSLPSFTAINNGNTPATSTVTVSLNQSGDRTFTGTLDSNNPQLNDRYWRDNYAPACPNVKSFPGTIGGGTYPYATHNITNTTGADACVTITYGLQGSGDIAVSVYSGSFDPNNLSGNYLSDGGNSAYQGSDITFSFNLAAGATAVIVANTADYSEAQNYHIAVTGMGVACPALPKTFTITVNPSPASTISYGGSPYCANTGAAPVTQTGATGGTFSALAGLSIDAATGLINPSQSTPGTYTVTYTVAASGGCAAATSTASVDILADSSAVSAIANQVLCANSNSTAVTIGGSIPGNSYSWSNSDPSIGLAASGMNTIPSFTAVNNGSTPKVAYVTITPLSASGCTNPQVYAITVLPRASMNAVPNQSVCTGMTAPIAFAGNATSYSWTNSNTAIGLAASGTGSGIPAFTATNNSSAAIQGSIAATPEYSYNGTTCTGKVYVFVYSVKPTPSVNTPANQVVCAAASSTAVSFSGSHAGTTYSWINDNPSIGLTASGTGNIASFSAVNNSAVAQSATVTVTPVLNQCRGTATSFTFTVSPSAGSISYSGSPYCQSTSALVQIQGTRIGTFSSSPAGLSINASTGIINTAASTPGTYTVTFTVSNSTCISTATTSVTILPQATVNAVPNAVYCNGAVTAAMPFSGSAASYSWTNDNTSVGLAASGTGTSLPSFTATNATPAIQYAYINVTPLGNGVGTCNGRAVRFRITVFPTPSVDPIADQVYCRGAATTPLTFAGPVAGTTYSWNRTGAAIGLAATRGSNSIPSFVTTNATAGPISSTLTVTTNANKCPGSSMTFQYIVNDCIAFSGGTGGGNETGRSSANASSATPVVTLAPNPARHMVTVLTGRPEAMRMQLLDATGTVVLPIRIITVRGQFNLEGLSRGTYYVQLFTFDGKKSSLHQVIRL
ncbi:MAG: hypothetical protein EOO08_03535 [Chitinophagaceae bacterium]|nr:MAG: hypothetical protein EOO08_03535 [Chitinophagaceae bacterium]